MPERSGIYFFDTVTLSNFALAGRMDLLVSRYGTKAQVTAQVLDEVTVGIVAGYGRRRDIELAVTDGVLGQAGALSGEERETYSDLLHVLALGEASCLACARHRGGIVVTDDRVARECCIERDIRLTGTIGILKASCAEGCLSGGEADEALLAMIAAGYHSPVRRITDLL